MEIPQKTTRNPEAMIVGTQEVEIAIKLSSKKSLQEAKQFSMVGVFSRHLRGAHSKGGIDTFDGKKEIRGELTS